MSKKEVYNTIPVGKLSPELEKIAKAIQDDIERQIPKNQAEIENEKLKKDAQMSKRSSKKEKR